MAEKVGCRKGRKRHHICKGGSERVALNSGPKAWLDAALDDPKNITSMVRYERIDTKEGYPTRIDSIDVYVSDDGSNWGDSVTIMTKHTTLNYAVERWSLEGIILDAPASRLWFAANGKVKKAGMTFREIEAYESPANRFFGQTAILPKGARYSAPSFEPDYLRDGYVGASDSNGRAGHRLALAGGNEAWLDVTLAQATGITIIGRFERVDQMEGHASRIDSIELQVRSNESICTAVMALNDAMRGIVTTLVLAKIVPIMQSTKLPIGIQMQMQVLAHYDRGLPGYRTNATTYTSGKADVVAMLWAVVAGGYRFVCWEVDEEICTDSCPILAYYAIPPKCNTCASWRRIRMLLFWWGN